MYDSFQEKNRGAVMHMTVFVYAFILPEGGDRHCIWQLFMHIPAKKYLFLSGTLSLLLPLLKMLLVILTRILHLSPCL